MSPDDQVSVTFAGANAAPALQYFSDRTGRYHALGLDFDGYLAQLLETRAMYRWQELFVADATFEVPDAAQLRRTLSVLPRA